MHGPETTARRELAGFSQRSGLVDGLLNMNHFRVSLLPRRLFSRWLLSPPQRLPLGIPIKIAILEKIESALSFPFSPASSQHKKGNLSKGVYANKFVLLSSFTLKTTICPKIWAKTLPRNVKSLLPVNVRHSKTKRGLCGGGSVDVNEFARRIFFWGLHSFRKWNLLLLSDQYLICANVQFELIWTIKI